MKTLAQRTNFYDLKVRQFCAESVWDHKLRRSKRLAKYCSALMNMFEDDVLEQMF